MEEPALFIKMVQETGQWKSLELIWNVQFSPPAALSWEHTNFIWHMKLYILILILSFGSVNMTVEGCYVCEVILNLLNINWLL